MQVITTHVNADFDCLASMVAAQKLYPAARMVFSGSLEKSTQDYLKRFHPPFPFHRLREIRLDEVELLVVVDTQDPGRIGPFKSLIGRPGVRVHLFDHHLDVVHRIAAEQATVKRRGSSTTVLFEILADKSIPLTHEECTLFLLGIYQDTHSLISTSTTPEDLSAVGELLKRGADLNVVAEFIQPRLNQEQIAVMNELIRSLEVLNINGIEVALAAATVQHYVGDLAVVPHKIMELENLSALIILVRLDTRVYLIGRSRSEAVNLGEIFRQFGGGGHAVAASASLKDMTLVQAREKLLALLNETVRPPSKVRDIMHAPVISVAVGETLESAGKVLTRFNLNTLPVVSGRKTLGLITRQIVEKAIHHKMGRERVEEVMIHEFSTTVPEAEFKTVIPMIIEKKQKLVPVEDPENRELVGIISRGELLRVLYRDMIKYSDFGAPGLFEGSAARSKNVKSMMKERMPKEIMTLFDRIVGAADENGMAVYVVGGFVRDLLLGIKNLDIDIVVEGDGIAFARALGKKFQGRVRSHPRFGTSRVVLPEGFKIDIASARMEYYKHPAALPTVEMSSIKSDLFRRDFSFNSLAIQLNGEDAFQLIDFFNGQKDLKDGFVRVLHNLSFIEDPSRAFRAIRFEQRFGFKIGKQTEAFMKSAIRKGLIDRLSGTRLLNELIHLMKEKNPLNCILRMQDFDLMKSIHPRMLQDPETIEVLRRVEAVLSWSRMVPLPREPETWYIYLLGVFYPLDARDFGRAMDRLKMPVKLRERLGSDCEGCRGTLRQLGQNREFAPGEIYDLFSRLSPEGILFSLAVSPGEKINKYALLYFSQYYSCARLCLNGDDLIQMGMKPGPVFQTVFKALRDARLRGEVLTREDEMALVTREFLPSRKN